MYTHKSLAAGRWFELSFAEQLANVGTDIERAIKFKARGDEESSKGALFRALELWCLTIQDPKITRPQRREMCRAKEVFLEYFIGDNRYKCTDQQWLNYFDYFGRIAAWKREQRRKEKKALQSAV